MMKPAGDSILSGDFSEQRWVLQISKNFDDEDAGDNISDVPVCVFSVPNSTNRFKPEAYVPQAIALGPYHHFETHLYQMERYKVAAVKAILTPDQVLSFESLVITRLVEKVTMVRACYHKYMDLDDHTLAWIIAIDGLFLIGLFLHYVDIAPFMPKKLIHDGVLYRDVMVLENQIPLCLLNEIWNTLHLSSTFNDRKLISMLRKFCEVHSPLKLAENYFNDHETAGGYLHLVDLMYHSIVNNNQETTQHPIVQHSKDEDDHPRKKIDHKLGENIEEVIEMGIHLGVGKKAVRPLEVIKNINWEKISNLVGLKRLRDDEQGKDDLLPRVTEIEIPSVSSLSKYGQIGFNLVNGGGIRDVKFDKNKAALYLPVITLDDYSEVVLRNLLAYEVATCSSSSQQLGEYIDLMSGIVDTEDDVRILRGNGIIKGNMKDKDVADLFNGMNKNSGKSSNRCIVAELNEYYSSRPMIKAWRFVKKDLIWSRRVVTAVLTSLLCFLMIIYSFCEIYDCPRLFDGR